MFCIAYWRGGDNDSDDSGDEKDPDKKKFEGALSGMNALLISADIKHQTLAWSGF